ncbi:MAG: S8 family peptidase, partial [Planctomycetia bacterium]|nr:S8 family peptidase [Planctomycetia bacterium]
VTATLRAASPGPLDLALYDPTGLQVVRAFPAADAAPVAFAARGTLLLLVTRTAGAGGYTLDLRATATATVAATPGDASPTGDARPGDRFSLTGTAAPGRVATFLVPVPAAARLVVGAADGGPPGLACTATDASESTEGDDVLASGLPLAADVDAATLVRLDVRADAEGAFRLDLAVGPRDDEARTVVAASRLSHRGRVAALHREDGRLRGVPSAHRFGRPVHALSSGKALVKCATTATAATLRAHACRTAADHGDAWVEVTFDLPTGLSEEDRARATWSRVLALRAADGVAAATASFRRFARKTPNDPRYDEQWHYPLIRLPEAWDVTTGSSSVIVAVIDTGSTAHPDLSGRFIAGYDFISDPDIAADGNGRDTDATDPGDSEGGEPSSFHGTHVAGTIGAATNNGTGVAGVCWNVSIMPLRVLGKGGGDDADIVAAIRYAAGLSNASGRLPAQRAHVINMSLGGGGFDQAMQDAITAARNAGVVIFAAAGNSGTTEIEYPAGFDGVVSVAAVGPDSRRASYSNRNRTVDLAAPGGDSTTTQADGVLSTVYDDADGSPSATYAFYDGTSMATPHAAGVAALVLSVAPSLTPSQVESILFTTAKDLGTAGRDDSYGNGLIDAKAAVDKAKATASGAALLTLSPSSLVFEDGTDTLDATLGNAGSGKITVTGATVTTTSGGAWLAATLVGSGNAAVSATSVRVTVTRGSLADGTYDGSVRVDSSAGATTLPVTLVVGNGGGGGGGGGGGPDDVWVLVVDADTDETVAEALVAADGDGSFDIGDLPDGSYYLVAGSDSEDDGYLGDPGDWYGESDEVFDLRFGDRVDGVELFVSIDAGGFVRARFARRAP